MMKTDTPAPIPLPLQRLREQLDLWRQTKTYQTAPIPEDIWQQAIRLADQFSVNLVARTLRLNYEKLRTRLAHYVAQRANEPEDNVAEPVTHHQRSGSHESEQGPTFFEFNFADPVTASSDQHLVVQLSHHDGSQMSLWLPLGNGAHLGALIAAFLARRP